jgi:hypothetical protein
MGNRRTPVRAPSWKKLSESKETEGMETGNARPTPAAGRRSRTSDRIARRGDGLSHNLSERAKSGHPFDSCRRSKQPRAPLRYN